MGLGNAKASAGAEDKAFIHPLRPETPLCRYHPPRPAPHTHTLIQMKKEALSCTKGLRATKEQCMQR